AEAVADIVEVMAVGAPHGGVVLAVIRGEPAIVRAVGIAQREAVVGRSSVILPIPGAGADHVGKGFAVRAEGGFTPFRDGDAARGAAGQGDRPEGDVAGVFGAAA